MLPIALSQYVQRPDAYTTPAPGRGLRRQDKSAAIPAQMAGWHGGFWHPAQTAGWRFTQVS